MSLKQLEGLDRILFLKEFISEIVINSAKDEELKKRIEVEKIKRKYLESEPLQETGKYIVIEKKKPKPVRFEKSLRQPKLSFQRRNFPKRIIKRPFVSLKFKNELTKPVKSFQSNIPSDNTGGLGKINSLVKDSGVQMIECPGAGKNILVKVRNKFNATRIILNEVEIKNIIDYFSKSARIPVIGGIFKAAFGSLLISAVVSEYAGSRFIINKKSPYSLIEGVSTN